MRRVSRVRRIKYASLCQDQAAVAIWLPLKAGFIKGRAQYTPDARPLHLWHDEEVD
jgi:hypothetical protein